MSYACVRCESFDPKCYWCRRWNEELESPGPFTQDKHYRIAQWAKTWKNVAKKLRQLGKGHMSKKDLERIRDTVDQFLDMGPAPLKWNRERIECANGNEMWTGTEIAEYLNWTFVMIPKLCDALGDTEYGK